MICSKCKAWALTNILVDQEHAGCGGRWMFITSPTAPTDRGELIDVDQLTKPSAAAPSPVVMVEVCSFCGRRLDYPNAPNRPGNRYACGSCRSVGR